MGLVSELSSLCEGNSNFTFQLTINRAWKNIKGSFSHVNKCPCNTELPLRTNGKTNVLVQLTYGLRRRTLFRATPIE